MVDFRLKSDGEVKSYKELPEEIEFTNYVLETVQDVPMKLLDEPKYDNYTDPIREEDSFTEEKVGYFKYKGVFTHIVYVFYDNTHFIYEKDVNYDQNISNIDLENMLYIGEYEKHDDIKTVIDEFRESTPEREDKDNRIIEVDLPEELLNAIELPEGVTVL